MRYLINTSNNTLSFGNFEIYLNSILGENGVIGTLFVG